MTRLARLYDGLTMYRLVLVSLALLVALSFGLSLAHLVAPPPEQIALALVVLAAVSSLANRIFAYVFRVVEGQDSWLITALLLVLITTPVAGSDGKGLIGLALIALWATASKYLIAVRGKHVFNPAAFAVALAAVLIGQPASWWAASSVYLLPVSVVAGLLIGHKLRRLDVIVVLLIAHAGTVAATTPLEGIASALSESVLRSPLIFLTAFMATEPHTAPQKRWARLIYAAAIGALLAPNVHWANYYPTPEHVLLAGNLFAFLVGTWRRYRLTFVRQEPVGSGAVEFVFRPNGRMRFKPGQYMEWVVGTRDADSRGNRRYFTIASSPTEQDIRLGVKFYASPSAFKRSLADLKPGDTITGTQLAGRFVMPAGRKRKLAFIAGGIGITPFRSMLRYLIDRDDKRNVALLYGNATPAEIGYSDLLAEARDKIGLKVAHALLEPGDAAAHKGFVDEAMIRAELPDFRERLFYVSGPPAMVDAVKRTLRRMGVPPWRIRLDFFPGLG